MANPHPHTNLIKDMNIYTQEAQWTSSRKNSKGSTLRHIIKLLKAENKENLESSKREVNHNVQEITNKY